MLAALFFGLGFIAQLHHEMWRDELQAWSIALASPSLRDLLGNITYEGHPAFWYLLLYALTRCSDNPFLMQVFHLSVATAGIYVFARFAPFTRVQKLYFAFGYFPLYEYGVISRSYVLGVVGLFAFCAWHQRVREGALAPALILALVANTSVYGAMMALAFGLVAVFDLLTTSERPRASRASALSVYVLVIGLGIAASLAQSAPRRIAPPVSSDGSRRCTPTGSSGFSP